MTSVQQPFSEDFLSMITSVIEPHLESDETLADVLQGSIFLAVKRANLYDRDPTYLDLLYILHLFTWNPFKRPPSAQFDDELKRIRKSIFVGAAQGDVGRLDALPGALLMLSFDVLDQLLQRGELREFGLPDSS